jgi:hypothetical protein
MNEDGTRILEYLQAVSAERAARRCEPGLGARVDAIKAFQHDRFTRTYDDLLHSAAYADAARFFLDELYGTRDFTDRDAQFARTVPALVNLFPHDVVRTVRVLAELHAMSEQLDSAMGAALLSPVIDANSYGAAWLAVGRPDQRWRQIDAMLEVGESLKRFTRNRLLYGALRLMRKPAELAGLSALQDFLEKGFETFKRMPQPQHFLETVGARERRIATALFAGDVSSIT